MEFPNIKYAPIDLSRSAAEWFRGPHIAIPGPTERPNINDTTFDMSLSAKELPEGCHISIPGPTLGSLVKDVACSTPSKHGHSQAFHPSSESIND